MNKLSKKMLTPLIQNITNENGRLFFDYLLICVNNGIDINQAVKDCQNDYNIFWENIIKFVRDYNSIVE